MKSGTEHTKEERESIRQKAQLEVEVAIDGRWGAPGDAKRRLVELVGDKCLTIAQLSALHHDALKRGQRAEIDREIVEIRLVVLEKEYAEVRASMQDDLVTVRRRADAAEMALRELQQAMAKLTKGAA